MSPNLQTRLFIQNFKTFSEYLLCDMNWAKCRWYIVDKSEMVSNLKQSRIQFHS